MHHPKFISPVWIISLFIGGIVPLIFGSTSRAGSDLQPLFSIRKFEGHTAGVIRIAFSSDGKTAASASEDKTVRLWDIGTGKCIRTLEGHTLRVTCVAFSPDRIHLASGSEDGTIRVWNTNTGDLESVLKGHNNGVMQITYVDRSQIISTGNDNFVRFWEPVSEKELRKLPISSDTGGEIAISADAHSALICGDKEVRMVNIADGSERRRFDSGKGTISLLRFNPDGKTIMAYTATPNKLFIWKTEDGSIVRQADFPQLLCNPILSPDGKKLIGSYQKNTFFGFDPETGEMRQALVGPGSFTWACAFSPDSRYLLGGCLGLATDKGFPGGDTALYLWDFNQPPLFSPFKH